jgi:SAM-dependent methyltransferase
MFLGGELGYSTLRWFHPPCSWLTRLSPSSRPTPGKLESYWGQQIWRDLAGKTVIDFGCRTGADALDMARHGARHVIGLDIVPEALEVAAAAAERTGLSDCCTFGTTTSAKADAIICIDAFEHFDDPAAILETMGDLLTPTGSIYVTFGPPWYHPRGGHSFSVFPWAHLVFTESALIRWRADYTADGATCFREVAGGLNGMTLRRFEKLIAASPFQFASYEEIPIRAARWLHSRLTREFLTSMVRCRLVFKARS